MIPVMGSMMKIHEYQTPEENWGRPTRESQTTFKDANMMIRGRILFRLVRFNKQLASERECCFTYCFL